MPFTLAGRLADPDRGPAGDHCPIDRAVQAVGSRATLLLLREAAYGTTRFDDFAHRVGITDAVAAARLRELVELGVLERRPYREPGQRTRHEYVLTESGRELMPALSALGAWGRAHLPHRGTPTSRHAGCGAELVVAYRCAEGHELALEDIVVGR